MWIVCLAIKVKRSNLFLFNFFSPVDLLQPVYIQMRGLIMSYLIWIYTVCESWFTTNTRIAKSDASKFKDGRVYFRNSGMKGLKENIHKI